MEVETRTPASESPKTTAQIIKRDVQIKKLLRDDDDIKTSSSGTDSGSSRHSLRCSACNINNTAEDINPETCLKRTSLYHYTRSKGEFITPEKRLSKTSIKSSPRKRDIKCSSALYAQSPISTNLKAPTKNMKDQANTPCSDGFSTKKSVNTSNNSAKKLKNAENIRNSPNSRRENSKIVTLAENKDDNQLVLELSSDECSYASFAPFSTESDSQNSVKSDITTLNKHRPFKNTATENMHKLKSSGSPNQYNNKTGIFKFLKDLSPQPLDNQGYREEVFSKLEKFIKECELIKGSNATPKGLVPTPESLAVSPEFDNEQAINQSLLYTKSVQKPTQSTSISKSSDHFDLSAFNQSYFGIENELTGSNIKGLGVSVPAGPNDSIKIAKIAKSPDITDSYQALAGLEKVLDYAQDLVGIIKKYQILHHNNKSDHQSLLKQAAQFDSAQDLLAPFIEKESITPELENQANLLSAQLAKIELDSAKDSNKSISLSPGATTFRRPTAEQSSQFSLGLQLMTKTNSALNAVIPGTENSSLLESEEIKSSQGRIDEVDKSYTKSKQNYHNIIMELRSRLLLNGINSDTKYDCAVTTGKAASNKAATYPNDTNFFNFETYSELRNGNIFSPNRSYKDLAEADSNLLLAFTELKHANVSNADKKDSSEFEIARLNTVLVNQNLEIKRLNRTLRRNTNTELIKFKNHFDRVYYNQVRTMHEKCLSAKQESKNYFKNSNSNSDIDLGTHLGSNSDLNLIAPNQQDFAINKTRKLRKKSKKTAKKLADNQIIYCSAHSNTENFENTMSVNNFLTRSVSTQNLAKIQENPNTGKCKRNNTVSIPEKVDYQQRVNELSSLNGALGAPQSYRIAKTGPRNQRNNLTSVIEALDQNDYNYKDVKIDPRSALYSKELMLVSKSIKNKLSLKQLQNQSNGDTTLFEPQSAKSLPLDQILQNQPLKNITKPSTDVLNKNKYARPCSTTIVKSVIKSTYYSGPSNSMNTTSKDVELENHSTLIDRFNQKQPDPELVKFMAKAMRGEYLYVVDDFCAENNKVSNQELRFVWIHPYAKTLYWSKETPYDSRLSRATLDIRRIRYSKNLRSFIDLKNGEHARNSQFLINSRDAQDAGLPKSIYIEKVMLVSSHEGLGSAENSSTHLIKVKSNGLTILLKAKTPKSQELWYSVLVYIQSRNLVSNK